ncbi:DegT/DnrJ/EryC1/StrS family aminotransferase [Desulfovibrio litoralis]|uniref:dTDP-4-amino-4,6-dideoxygalactose transaminase n=1 Tax=Desulfovibrio litoralis DSM 11393 TaxID=1121455 RepID=A0A1M7TQP3_9BACT|nr:DegT/DnrJ/EryC1/StrS family aminotransferase [Desulfovibrio litoralis]SHN72996.1 dTDP-4-amino-4,6-dideoxygalactose transaminase [Desulfovibrio litoralis DSM 11393]
MIYVTKSFLPPISEYMEYLEKIFMSGQLTNQGSCVLELEKKLKDYLNVKYLQYVSNGTIAIQLALNISNITEGEIITTPFSYVATTGSILWERCTPIFVDIEENTYCIDADKIESAITAETKAILAVHVFGYPCNVEKIEAIAKKHGLTVIYDAAHAFGAFYKNKSLLSYGDISTCSFHATKLFHSVEGGCVIVNSSETDRKLDYVKRFGHIVDDYQYIGINAKNSEFHAAMGLANLPYLPYIISERKKISELYDSLLKGLVKRPKLPDDSVYNYAYYPVVFESEKQLLSVFDTLKKNDIIPRRYFYPSLNTLPYLKNKTECAISENIALRILCLPLYVGLKEEEVLKITDLIKRAL